MAGNRVRYRLSSLTKLLFHLTSITVTCIILLLLVGLHEIWESASTSLVYHILTILRILTHHLVLMLLLLLELVVESLELVVLWGVAMTGMRMRTMSTVALWTCKHIIDILAQADFWTESIHQVRRCVLIAISSHVSHSDVTSCTSTLTFTLILRELVEIRCLLHHMTWHHLLSIRWISTSSIAHGVPLQFIQTTGNALNLGWQLDSSLI